VFLCKSVCLSGYRPSTRRSLFQCRRVCDCEREPETKITVICNTQDTLNKLYSASSITDRGTLCQLKNDFNHRNVSTDVMKSFNYTDNFIRFTTEAHVVYLLLQLHESREDADTLLSELSAAAVDHLWSLPSSHSVAELLDGKAEDSYITDKWCRCSTGCAHNVSI